MTEELGTQPNFSCPAIIFSQRGGKTVGGATVQHNNKKWLQPRQATVQVAQCNKPKIMVYPYVINTLHVFPVDTKILPKFHYHIQSFTLHSFTSCPSRTAWGCGNPNHVPSP